MMNSKLGFVATIAFSLFILFSNDAIADDVALVREGNVALAGKDYDKAFGIFHVLAEHGIPSAQYNLGAFYLNGQGVQKDEKKAYDWFKKAALKGHEHAKQVIEKAATRGNEYATAALNEIKTITPEQPSHATPSTKVDAPPAKTLAKDISSKSKSVASPTNSGLTGDKFYFALDIGTVILKNIGADGNNPTFSYRITGGYKLTNNLSAELGYLHTSTGSYASSPLNSLYVRSEQLTAVYHYPIFGDFVLLGNLGFTNNATGGDAVSDCNCSSSITILYGLGAQYRLTKYFDTRIEYTSYGKATNGATNGDLTMSSLSWGLLYNF
jgi:hypothetical protein